MGGNARPKGYYKKDFEDTFVRYLSPSVGTYENAATPLLDTRTPANTAFSEVADDPVSIFSATDSTLRTLNSSGVAHKSGEDDPLA